MSVQGSARPLKKAAFFRSASMRRVDSNSANITPEVWAEFMASKSTDSFKEKSEKNKALRSKNVHIHLLGSRGYTLKKADWEKENTVPQEAGLPVP